MKKCKCDKCGGTGFIILGYSAFQGWIKAVCFSCDARWRK